MAMSSLFILVVYSGSKLGPLSIHIRSSSQAEPRKLLRISSLRRPDTGPSSVAGDVCTIHIVKMFHRFALACVCLDRKHLFLPPFASSPSRPLALLLNLHHDTSCPVRGIDFEFPSHPRFQAEQPTITSRCC